jgi:biotin carboxyl carrier protein
VRYEVTHEGETSLVEVREIAPDVFDVSIGGGAAVRVDARKTAGTVYSVLVGERQYEGSVDERDDGSLDVHLGTSAFDLLVVDERRKLLAVETGTELVGKQTLRAEMPGKVVKVTVAVGDRVSEGQSLLVVEAMKMENEIASPIDGVVTEVGVREGEAVETDAVLVVVEPPEQDGD